MRLAQVDAPESTGGCFATESTGHLKELALGRTVYLRRPPSAPALDRYGRTVADVLVASGTSVSSANLAMVADGFAEFYEQFTSEDTELAARLLTAENSAKRARLGLWSACATPATTSPPRTTSPPQPAPVASPSGRDCTPGYDPCIPPGDDVDCAGGSGNGPRYVQGPVRVDHRHGDPYDLDRDKDGVGCEN